MEFFVCQVPFLMWINTENMISVLIHIKKGTWQTKIPSNARLFICDAILMYTNIQTVPDLHRIGRFALENEKNLAVPPVVLTESLRLLMTKNVFQFGNKYWLQNVGTEMGAPPAPPWDTIFFSIHE